jgi:hypothetical protein
VLVKSLQKQFLHDLKASWPKTLLLAVLLVVGLFFWIPPLLRATVSAPRASADASASTRASALMPANTTRPDAPRTTSTSRSITWEKAEAVLASDPLVRSAEVAAIHGNPFQIAPDQFSPPILFAETEVAEETHTVNTASGAGAGKTVNKTNRAPGQGPPGRRTTTAKPEAAANVPDGLSLKSTILGEKRRAALINDKLYSEGSLIQVDGVSYILTVVRPREVELRKGEQTFLLTLPGATNIQVERAGAPVESP